MLIRTTLVALLAALLTACNPLSSLTGVVGTGVPDEAPSICGVITALLPDEVLVEENPQVDFGSAKAMMRLQEDTRVLYEDGRLAESSALAVGQKVSAWFDGPVAESYPVQTAAGVIVVEGPQGCS